MGSILVLLDVMRFLFVIPNICLLFFYKIILINNLDNDVAGDHIGHIFFFSFLYNFILYFSRTLFSYFLY